MAIFEIPYQLNLGQLKSWDLDDENMSLLRTLDDYPSILEQRRISSDYIRKLSIDQILDFFDALAIHWLTDPKRLFLNAFSSIGVSYLINFLRRNNLEELLNESLHGNYKYLDGFSQMKYLSKNLMAHPQGVITHWLAGNVPVLGMISLIQGLLTKNTNVLKLPRENGLTLPLMIAEIAKFKHNNGSGEVDGQKIADGCLFVYCEKDDNDAQIELSVNSNVRVAWGGRGAVESVMSLPRKYGTTDVIFGPKYSFAVFGKDTLNPELICDLANRMALDASFFEQQGCNSPHTVFVENGGAISPEQFAVHLASGMGNALKRIPKTKISPDEAYAIVNTRSEYSFFGKVFKSEGTEWTVVYSDDEGLADACYSRVVFVRPVDDVFDVLQFIEHNKHQTLGLSVHSVLKERFALEATRRGIERVTDIGKMSAFDYPWDGMFPVNKFVRWVSLTK
jgi:hypothetical protein